MPRDREGYTSATDLLRAERAADQRRMTMTRPIDYIAPRYRRDPLAGAFADGLAARLPWTPGDFGSGYAWESDIPPRDRWEDEAEALAAHLTALGAADGR